MLAVRLITLIISLCLEIWLGILLLRRGAQKHVPIFFSYIVISIPVSAALLLTINHYYVYFFVFWASELLQMLFSLAALNEVFWWSYQGFRFLWWFRLIYYGAIALALAVTVRAAIVHPPVQAHLGISLIVDGEITANLVKAAIVGVFIVMIRPMVIEFQRYPFGIVAGFGASSLGPSIAYFMFSAFGTKFESLSGILDAVSYIVALVIWLVVFLRPDTEQKEWEPPIPPEEMTRTVRGYLEAIGFSRKSKRKRK